MKFISSNYLLFFFALIDFIGEICMGLQIFDSTDSVPFCLGIMALSITVLGCVCSQIKL